MTNTVRRMVLLFAAALVGVALTSGAAAAQTQSSAPDPGDYSSCATFNVSNPTPAPGETVHVSGKTATANAHVVIVLTDQNGGHIAAETDSNSTSDFGADVTIPTTSQGTVKVQAFQTGDDTDPIVGCPSQVASLEIVAPTAGAALARTGSPNSTLPLARLGVGLLAAGGIALTVARRRRASVAA